ncbi:putative uncharacterized protein [Sutterella sp. CAG:351]|mgnify:CR=1|jgi:hypothetical protein|uniref:hypothetical protein n=1 Tax=Dakarella massiliensis TaxID=1506471 RepID=UPI000340C66D|nr:hypothetical protein [Dakarella massiliensis]CDE52012.1 putative uncharacterized protein [Sutterella sp. CAG:351]
MARPKKREPAPLPSDDPLRQLLASVSPERRTLTFSEQQREEGGWSDSRWKALLDADLVKPAPPSKTANCDRCEQQCINLDVIQPYGRKDATFIVCPAHHGDIIAINPSLQTSFQFSVDRVIQFLTDAFDCRPLFDKQPQTTGFLLGVVLSGNHRVLLFLEHEQQTGWVLRAEDSHHPTLLADVLAFDGVDYTLDPLEKAILLWADKSTEPPIARAHRIWAEVDQAIKMHPVGGAYQFVAQKNGISVDQTKKIVSRLKRQPAAFKEHQIFLRWMAEKKQI